MTKSEAEEIFLSIVMSEKTGVVQMSLAETKVFRVLIGRVLKEMERKNRTLYYKARDYGIEYKEPYAVIRRHEPDRFKVMTVSEDGSLHYLVKPTEDKEK